MSFSFFEHIEHFAVVGTNFTKADTETRSRFAITKTMTAELYEKVRSEGYLDFQLLSTCNRTEFYACGPIELLKNLAKEQLNITEEELNTYFYCLSGMEAVRHYFRVVSGLDSQIVGDYEIVCQVKSSLDEARQHGLVGTITDRISNFALQASKQIKTNTNLSNGKYSVSYAAVELMQHQLSEASIENILVVGTGDFGSTVARNMRHYFPNAKLWVTNRTLEKAETLAAAVRATVLPFDAFTNALDSFDVIVTTVGSDAYLIHPQHIHSTKAKLFLDLSVPQAVDPRIKECAGVGLYTVDEVSAFHNQLLAQRQLEIPRAEKIVEEFIGRLMTWQMVANHTDVIVGYKEKLSKVVQHSAHHAHKMEKTFSGLIQQIRLEGYRGCSVIQTMNEIIAFEK